VSSGEWLRARWSAAGLARTLEHGVLETTFVDGTDATSRSIFFTELVASTTAERSARERL
jgi:hypothetical protein